MSHVTRSESSAPLEAEQIFPDKLKSGGAITSALSNAISFRRQVMHLHALGPRAMAEILVEIADETGGAPVILKLLAEYETRLDQATVRLVGGDRFPRLVPLLVPR
jgi:hypothetical protein